jgi:hypothetical protein
MTNISFENTINMVPSPAKKVNEVVQLIIIIKQLVFSNFDTLL